MDHKKAVKLEDSELEMVTGGTGLQAAPIGVITVTTCDNFLCCWCRGGKKAGQSGHYCEAQGGEAFPDSWFDYTCKWCDHMYTCPNANRTAAASPNAW